MKREIDSNDLRRHRLTLTADGRKMTTSGTSMLADAFGRRLERLDVSQQRELRALPEKLV